MFFLHFLGLTCYFGVIFHLRVLLFFHLCRSQASLPPFCSFWGWSLWLQPALRQGLGVMCSLALSVLPLSLENRICCSQVGCAFTCTDVSIHNSFRKILALVTNPYSTEYFLLCLYLKICLRKQLPTVVSAYGVGSGHQDCCKDTIPNIGITHKQPCEI